MREFISTMIPVALFVLIIAGGWWLARAWSRDFNGDSPHGPQA
jgi:positive regulator of sigma E activity